MTCSSSSDTLLVALRGDVVVVGGRVEVVEKTVAAADIVLPLCVR